MAKRKAVKKSSGRRAATKRTSPRRAATKSSAKRASAKRTKGAGSAAKQAKSARSAANRKNAAKSAARRTTPARTPKGTAGPTGKPVRPQRTSSPVTTAVRGAVAGAIAAVSNRLPWTADSTDAITLLEADHRRMEDLLKQGEQTTARGAKKRTDLLHTLTRELNAHELMEEKVLYPALQSHPEARDIVLEGYEEHHVADLIVEELHGLARNDEQWGAKFKVLKENIEHHIEEEEGEMFPTARGLFTREQLQELGTAMVRMKAEALDTEVG